jgi:hypothetical protein
MRKPLVSRGETQNRKYTNREKGEKENRNGQMERRKRIKEKNGK